VDSKLLKGEGATGQSTLLLDSSVDKIYRLISGQNIKMISLLLTTRKETNRQLL